MRNIFFAFACIFLLAACSQPAAEIPTLTLELSPTIPVLTPTNEPTPEPTPEPLPYPYYKLPPTAGVPYPPPGEPPTPTSTPINCPFYTRVPVPSLTPKPRPVVTILPANAGQIPKLTFDLWYQVRSQVLRLNHKTGQIDVLVDMSAWIEGLPDPHLFYREDKIILGNGFSESAPYGMQTWQVIHPETDQIEVMRQFEIGPGKDSLGCTSVSPDGNWFTYCRAGWNQNNTFTNYELILVSTTKSFAGKVLGSLADSSNVYWSPDSRFLIWATNDGIWSASPTSTPKLILPKGPQAESFLFSLKNPEWSGTGPYVMIDHLGTMEGGSKAILNVQTGQIADIPDTWTYVYPAAQASWLPGARLITIKPGDWMEGSFPIQVYLWRLEENGPEMLRLEKTFPISGIDPNYIPFSPIQLNTGQVLFAVLPDDNVSVWSNYQWEGGLYSIHPQDPQPVKLNTFPLELRQDQIRSLIWNPDGRGLFMETWTESGIKFWYIPTGSGPLYDLTPLIGEQACCFEWLP